MLQKPQHCDHRPCLITEYVFNETFGRSHLQDNILQVKSCFKDYIYTLKMTTSVYPCGI